MARLELYRYVVIKCNNPNTVGGKILNEFSTVDENIFAAEPLQSGKEQ